MLPLADAAKCRSESDWLVGINGTRALTALNSRHGGFRLTPVGRVQTPTLSILAQRERDIAAFVNRAPTLKPSHFLKCPAAGIPAAGSTKVLQEGRKRRAQKSRASLGSGYRTGDRRPLHWQARARSSR
jgi:DNA topoisomerase IA